MVRLPFGKKDPIQRLKAKDYADREERDALIEAGIGQSRDQETLVSLLFQNDASIRRASMKRLRDIAGPPAVEAFTKLARDRPASIVQAIATALAGIISAGGRERALSLLEHKDQGIRRAAEVFVLAGPLDQKVLVKASEWLETGDSRRGLAIIQKIEQTLREDPSKEHELIRLVRVATEHSEENTRQVAWRILAARNDPNDLEIFIDAISRETYSNQKMLSDAIAQLARRGTVDVSETLMPLLGSTTAVLRTTAVNVLKRLGDTNEIIRKFVLSSRTMPALVRERALETLGDLGEQVIEPLLSLMADEDPELCTLAITMASKVGADKRMVQPLIRALGHKEWWVQATAAETLGDLGDPAAIEPLTRLLRDQDTVWTAISALASTAQSLATAGNARASGQALQPLLGILKGGQRDKGGQTSDDAVDLRLEVINALRPMATERNQEVLRRVAQNDTAPRVRSEALSAASAMAHRRGTELADEKQLRAAIKSNDGADLTGIDKWLAEARRRGASDLHIAAGQPVSIRRYGQLVHLIGEEGLPAEKSARLIRGILNETQAAEVARIGQLNLSYTVEGHGRFRGNIFSDYHGINAVFRVIPDDLPTVQSIGLPPHLTEVQYWHQGLLLVCGAAGSGKTTTLTALINLINETRESHILTVEDPIEYIHASRRSLVNQRELGHHTRSYGRALRGALREDPDVIVIGELNDAETVHLAMEASETGHLVIGTLNCTRAITAIDRVVGSFSQDEQNQVRLALSESLKGVIAQSLMPAANGTSMAAIFEILMGTSQVSNLIRENKSMLIESLMQTGQSQGMQTYDDALTALVRSGRVTREEAWKRARDRKLFENLDDDQPTAQA